MTSQPYLPIVTAGLPVGVLCALAVAAVSDDAHAQRPRDIQGELPCASTN